MKKERKNGYKQYKKEEQLRVIEKEIEKGYENNKCRN